MGGGEAERAWPRELEEFVKRVEEVFGPLEAVLVYGSFAKGLEGVWSDVDVLVVSDSFAELGIADRILVLMNLAEKRVEPLGYTYEELKNMVEKANSLALNALIDGVALKESPRIRELRKRAASTYTKKGGVWIPTSQKPSRFDGAESLRSSR